MIEATNEAGISKGEVNLLKDKLKKLQTESSREQAALETRLKQVLLKSDATMQELQMLKQTKDQHEN